MKEQVRRLASRILVGSRLTQIRRRTIPKPGTVIFYGHRVRTDDEGYLRGLKPSWFRDQLEYLGRNYEVISLTRLVECFERGIAPPVNSAVITFDDGFRDNFENAFPLLLEMKMPAAIFAVTGSLTTGELPWPQQVGVILQQATAPAVELPFNGNAAIQLVTPRDRSRAFATLFTALKTLARAEREQALARLAADLGVTPPRDRMLTWEQAREMRASGLIEIGSHTYSHPWMEHLSLDEAKAELVRSKSDLADRLGVERPLFCFPGGSRTAELVELVRKVGYRSVFQSRPSLRYNNLSSTDQYGLSRIGFPFGPAYLLEAELDGPFHFVRQLYRRNG